MPTGYTQRLADLDLNLKEWLLTSIPRAFGLFVELRDEKDLTLENLKKALKNNDHHIDYHREQLAFKINESLINSKKADAEWEKEYQDLVKSTLDAYEKRKIEQLDGRLARLEIMSKIEDLITKSENQSDFIKNALRFSAEQLNSDLTYEYSEDVYKTKLYDSWEEHKLENIKETQEEVSYHAEKLEKYEIAKHNNYVLFCDYIKFIEENLK